MRKLVGLFAGAAILVAACGGTSTTTPAPSTAPAASTPAESAAPSAVERRRQGPGRPVRHDLRARRAARAAAR